MILGTCRFCFFMKQTLRNAFVTFIACIAATLFSQTVQAAAGDLYDGGLNAANNPIYKFDGAGNRTVFVSGNYTDALAFDSKGNLFAADPPDNLILKITPNGTTTTFAMNITPAGIAFDAAGNLFAIDTATDSIFKYTPSGTTRTTFAGPGIAGMNWLAFDRAGNLFVTITGNGQAGGGSIVKFASSCTSNCVPSTFYPVQPGGLWLPQGLAFDGLGNLYEADLGSGSIFRFTPTGTKTTFTSGLNGPRSLAFDTNGVLYAGEFGSHDIVKFPGGVKTAFSHDDTFIGGLAFEPPTAQLTNISTRGLVQTGNDVMIGGFIVQGTGPKKVIIRAIGPELMPPPYNIPNALADPTLELHNGTGALIASNNNWQTTVIGGIITSNQVSAIQNSGHAPTQPSESAIIATLPPGNYTAIVRGVNNTIGVALVEVYDLSPDTISILGNISTRDLVQTGNDVMIGGFIVQGTGPKKVIIRAIGPELMPPPYNIPNALADPTLELHNGTGALIASNNNWQTTVIGGIITSNQVSAIQNSGHAPTQPSESAIIATLQPGNYTAIVRGVNNTIGVALVEVYDLPPF